MTVQAKYGVKHIVKMGDYGERIEIEASLVFDIPEGGTVESNYQVARDNLDRAIRPDLERAERFTAFDKDDTYIHEYVEDVYSG